MLRLNNKAILEMNRLAESVDVYDMDSIREYMEAYIEAYECTDIESSAMKESVIHIMESCFDYRDVNYEKNLSKLNKMLEACEPNVLTEPLYVINRKLQGNINIEASSPLIENKSTQIYNKLPDLFRLGPVLETIESKYRFSMESNIVSLANQLQLLTDSRCNGGGMRGGSNKILVTPELCCEPIHPNFEKIDALFEDYLQMYSDSTGYEFSCSLSAIVDKAYLCNVSFLSEGYSLLQPSLFKLYSTNLLNGMFELVESTVLKDPRPHNTMGKITETFSQLICDNPSRTVSSMAKVASCCAMDLASRVEDDKMRKTLTNKILRQMKRIHAQSRKIERNGQDRMAGLYLMTAFDRLTDLYPEHFNLQSMTLGDDIVPSPVYEGFEFEIGDYVHVSEITKESFERSLSDLLNLSESNDSEMIVSSTTEAFQIDENGNIKVTFQEKTTYMNEYSMNHNLLVQNYKMRDFEAMKYNLVYHQILLESIENDVLHSGKYDKEDEVYRDAMDARSYIKSDLSQYLPIVRKNDPSFDLNKFYRKVKAEKNTVTIDGVSTIKGVKTLIRTIRMV